MKTIKVVVTGSNGLLGQKLIKTLIGKKNVEVFALSRGENRLHQKKGYTYYKVDLTDRKRVETIVKEIEPDYVIHTAAMTNVDACELNPDECDRLNVEVVEILVGLCHQTEARLIHLSTDFVFSGLKGSDYSENDLEDPVNYYGLSKLKSERLIVESGVRHAILRTVLVYGLVDGNDRSNVVLWVKNSLEQGKTIKVVTDQWRMPTLADDLAEACWLVIENEVEGIFNVSSSELMSIYEVALEVAEVFELDKGLIQAIETSGLNLPAARPVSTGLDLSKSKKELKLPLRSFSERLRFFKKQLDTIE